MSKRNNLKIDSSANFVIASGKGGVGKTTAATQLLAAYLYSVNGGEKVKYYEVDDVNKSSQFKKSEIIEADKLAVNDAVGLSMAMGEFGNCVIDIGGNKTSELVINNIYENGDLENVTWFIPMGVEEVEAKEAAQTYSIIQKIYMDEEIEPKIIFILNNLILDDEAKQSEKLKKEQIEFQFSNYFGSQWLPMSFVLKEKIDDPQNIFLERTTHIKMSTTYFNKLLVEIGNKDFLADIQAKKNVAKRNYLDIKAKDDTSLEDIDKAHKEWESSIQIFRICNQIKKYCEEAIHPQFDELNRILFN